ncbi:MAG: hypothetical protein FLDDKLPJ_02314 [Phycisphaerae bacterium]|nr:hypothetical protein [Phycisphaerae bacterium]
MAANLPTVIVPVSRHADSIAQLLESIARSAKATRESCPPIILVADSGSLRHANELPENLRSVCSITVHSDRSQMGKRNFGVHLATTEWVVFLDDDVVVRTNFVKVVREECDGAAPVVQGTPFLPSNAASTLARLEALLYARGFRRYLLGAQIVGWLDPRILLIRTDVARDFPFDETIRWAGEGQELAGRLGAAGVSVRWSRRLIGLHRNRASLTSLIRQKWVHGRGRAEVYTRCNRSISAGLLLPALRRHVRSISRDLANRPCLAIYGAFTYGFFWMGCLAQLLISEMARALPHPDNGAR